MVANIALPGIKFDMPDAPASVFEISRSALPALIRQAQRLNRLNTRLRQRLPPELQLPFQLARLEQGVAVLHTTTPAWATRLHFAIPTLLKHLAALCDEPVVTIHISVQPAESEPQRQTLKAPALTEHATACLLAAAEHLTDPDLASALKKLASRGANAKTS